MSQAKRLVLILILGITLRLGFLVHHNLWFDEAVSILISRLPIPQLLQAANLDNNPPLYSLLLHYWMKLIGGDHKPVWFAAWLRIPSLIFSVLTIPATYLLAKTAINERIAKLSALLTTLMPVQLYYADEIRPYSLFILLSTLLFYYSIQKKKAQEEGCKFSLRTTARLSAWLVRRNGKNSSKPNLSEQENFTPFLIVIILTAALLLSHYTGIVVIIATILYIIYTRTRVISSLISILTGILLASPWYWNALAQPHPLPWKPNTFLSITFMPIATTAGFTGIASPRTVLQLPIVSQIIIALLALLSLGILVRFFVRLLKLQQLHSKEFLTILIIFVLVSTASTAMKQFSNVTMFLSPRLILPFTPLIYIAIAKELEAKRRTRIIFLGLVICSILISYSPTARGPKLSQSLDIAESFKSAILHTAPTTFYPSLIYGKPDAHVYIGPQIFPSQLTRMIGGIPIPKSEAVDLNAMTLVIDTKNTLPQVNEAVQNLLGQTHLLTESKQVDTILIQHFEKFDDLFVKDNKAKLIAAIAI